MMRKLLLAALLLGSSAVVMADTITLKDGQEFEADVADFDSYYLYLVIPGRDGISVPWPEVKSIRHTTTQENWIENNYITADETEVKTVAAPLSASLAMQKALFPGVAMRGAGHFYAKDTNMGMSLLSAEIVSLIMMGLSVSEMLQPQEGSQATVVSQAVFFSGLAIFGGSWLYDIIFSPAAVERLNKENGFTDRAK